MPFFIILLVIIIFIYFYPALRLLPLLLGEVRRKWVWMIPSLLIALPFLHIFFRITGRFGYLADITGTLSFLVLGYMTLLVCLTLLHDIILLCLKLKKRYTVPKCDIQQTDLSRRLFLRRCSAAAVVCTTGGVTGYGWFQASQDPRIFKQIITIPKLHKALRGTTILQLSDLHIGSGLRGDFIDRIVSICRDIPADILILTGDLVDGRVHDLQREIMGLAHLDAPLGKYFVTGNHEYYSGVEEWLQVMQSLGFTNLLNEGRLLTKGEGSLFLAGVTDYNAGRLFPAHTSSPARALREAPPEAARILLAHQPKSVYQAAQVGVDLQISGHTHGGQYFPGNILVRLDQPFIAGLYRHESTQLYVSRGTGYWGPPLRLAVPSEITLLTLM